MKRKWSLWIMVLLIILVIVGCLQPVKNEEMETEQQPVESNTETDEKIIIAGIYKAGDQVWFISEGEAAEETAKEMGADEFIYIDAKMNTDIYLQAIDDVIDQKVDGVLTCIPDQQLSKVTVEKLNEVGIPVVAVDDALQDENGNKIAPWVGINAYNIGAANGEWMANYMLANKLQDSEDVGVLLLTMDIVSSCVPRTKGEYNKFTELIPDFPEERIFRADYNGETAKGFIVAADIYASNPQIKKWMVMTANEEGAIGAVRALEQAGLDKESAVIGLGGYLGSGEFEKEYSAYKATTYFSARVVGAESARILMNYILHGQEMPLESAVKAIIIDKSNYKDLMDEYK